MKILIVCLGNICRSPIAQGIMESKIRAKGLDWKVDSAGTSDWHLGERPDFRSIAVAKSNGINIKSQRARRFKASDFDKFDLILVMDAENYRDVITLARSDKDGRKVQLILNYVNQGMNKAVPDPYFDGSFGRVFNILDDACEKIIDVYAKNEI